MDVGESGPESFDKRDYALEKEIDLRELFAALWQGKWIIVAVTVCCSLASLFYALSLPNIYRAEALLAPANVDDSGGAGALAAQYGGLASLAGINIDSFGNGQNKIALGVEVLKSRKFISDFVARRKILVPLMATNGWSLKDNSLEFDKDIYDISLNEWVRNVDPPRMPKPSLLEAYEAFIEIQNVSQDSDTGFVKISIDHYSPYVAKQWVDWLIEDINSTLRQHDVSEAEKSILYLENQLETTSFAELQTIFYQLIEEQTTTIMLANARPEYLFRTLDPAVVEEYSFKPQRAIIFIVGTLIGMVLSAAIVVLRAYILPGQLIMSR